MTTRVLDIALNAMWAMEQEALERLLTIAAREHTVDNEALAAYRAKALESADRTTLRDGVAIMNVEGALFPKANLMTDISGATSYDILRRDLQAVADAGKAKALILNIDSPGGAVNGCSEFAQALYEMRGKMPIVAYVRGMGASAAYLIASAADHIVVNDMSEIGSCGCMMTLRETDDPKGTKTFQFISSQSPMKNVDPSTDAGAKAYQDRVDAMAQVYLETVARNRGVDTETALKNFGKGGILIGKGAVEAGLADAVGSFEAVLADLASGKKSSSRNVNKGTATRMSEATEQPAATAAPVDHTKAISDAVGAALASERTRNAGIDRIAAAHVVEASVVAKAKEDGVTVEAFALQVADLTAAAAKTQKETALAALKADEVEAAKAGASDAKEPGEKTAEQVAADIIAAAKQASGE